MIKKYKIICLMLVLAFVTVININVSANVPDVPFCIDFPTEGYVPLATDGYTVNMNNRDGTIKVDSGRIQLVDGTTGAAYDRYLWLDFGAVSSGILVVEVDFRQYLDVSPTDDLVGVWSSDGKRLVGFRPSGNGTPYARLRMTNGTELSGRLDHYSWALSNLTANGMHRIKFEIDLDNDTYTLHHGYANDDGVVSNYKQLQTVEDRVVGGVTVPAGTTVFKYDNSSAENAAKVRLTFSKGGDSFDNIRVYEKVSATQGSENITTYIGGTTQAGITYTPSNKTMGDLSWISSDTCIATVDQTGNITGVAKGLATITAESKIYGVNFTYNVTVAEPATGLSLNESAVTISRGTGTKLAYSIIPTGAAAGNVSWTSSDNSIATVDSDGNVVGVGEGEAIITALSSFGGLSAQCHIKVIVPVTELSISPSAKTMNVGGTAALTAVIAPEDASAVEKKWISENPYIATVDDNGVVTATGVGSTKVFVSCDGFYASCTINVNGASDRDASKNPHLISFIKDMGYETPELGQQTITADEFSDLASVEWAQEAILNMIENKIMKTDSENVFGAERNITRGEFVSVLIKTLKLENKSGEAEGRTFEDVTEEHEFCPYILKAAELEIIKGTSDTEFSPDEEISRQDMAVVVYNSMKTAGVDMKLAAPDFVDSSLIAAYAKKSIGSLTGMGIITGKPNGFDPLANMTRAEAAVLADRIIKFK